jgi:hypothetical protein
LNAEQIFNNNYYTGLQFIHAAGTEGSTEFGPDMEKIAKCRKLHDEMLNASRNVINSHRIGWVTHVART